MTTNYLNTVDAATRAQIFDVLNTKMKKVEKFEMLVYQFNVPAHEALNISNIHYRPAGYTLDNATFGVEIECSDLNQYQLCQQLQEKGIQCYQQGYNHKDSTTYFKIVRDGSLRGGSPAEVVSPILRGRDGLHTLETVCGTLQEIGAKVNNSCGLHVQLGVEGFNTKRIQNLLINYRRLETLIDSMMPASRRGNCQWCNTLTRYNEECIRNSATIESLTRYLGTRYMKVNLESYNRHKTVEFRQHSGTIDYKKIEMWLSFLQNLISYSKKSIVAEGITDINYVPFIGTTEREFYFERIRKFNA